MNTSIRLVSVVAMLACASACSSNSSGGTGEATGEDSGSGASASGSVTAVVGSVAVPSTFTGTPAKIIFGYGTKQITDGNGKMINIPTAFLPSLAGIANPTITAGQSYQMNMTGVQIPDGDYYLLVALYVEGTSGTIPEQGKDYIAGTTTTVHVSGSTLTLPALSFQVSQGQGT